MNGIGCLDNGNKLEENGIIIQNGENKSLFDENDFEFIFDTNNISIEEFVDKLFESIEMGEGYPDSIVSSYQDIQFKLKINESDKAGISKDRLIEILKMKKEKKKFNNLKKGKQKELEQLLE